MGFLFTLSGKEQKLEKVDKVQKVLYTWKDLIKLTHAVMQRITLTPRQDSMFKVLCYFSSRRAAYKTPITTEEVALYYGTSTRSALRCIARLEKKGFVLRSRCNLTPSIIIQKNWSNRSPGYVYWYSESSPVACKVFLSNRKALLKLGVERRKEEKKKPEPKLEREEQVVCEAPVVEEKKRGWFGRLFRF